MAIKWSAFNNPTALTSNKQVMLLDETLPEDQQNERIFINDMLSYLNINIQFVILPVSGTTQQIAINRGYNTHNASLTTFTLPAAAAIGDYFKIIGKFDAGGWLIAQNAGQYCVVGKQKSTTGVAGSISSTDPTDGIELVCTVANTEFTACASPQGNITTT